MSESSAAPKKKTGLLSFFKETRAEVSKVTWPTARETKISTIMVFVMVFICAVFLFLADQVFMFFIDLILS